jgi:hypothetical protein
MKQLHNFLNSRRPLDVSTISPENRPELLREIREYYDFLKCGEPDVRRKMAGDPGYLYVYEEELKRCKAAIAELGSPKDQYEMALEELPGMHTRTKVRR